MLNANFAIQAIEALPTEELQKVVTYINGLSSTATVSKIRKKQVELLPQHSTDAMVLNLVMNAHGLSQTAKLSISHNINNTICASVEAA